MCKYFQIRKLSIIIPVFNEKNTVAEILKRVVAAPVFGYEKQIIVVNDGSDDGTKRVLDGLSSEMDFICLNHSENLGKGEAIKTALSQVDGDYVIIQDADLEYDPRDYEKLLKEVTAGDCVIYGSRNLVPQRYSYLYCFLGVKFLTFLINLLFGSRLTDIYTCYKLIPAPLFKSLNLQSSCFEIEAEITAKILKRGYKIKEVGITYFPRSYSQGKKIRIHHGLKSIWIIIKNLLDPRE